MEGRCLSIGALRAARPDWIEKKLIRPLLTTKSNNDPFFKDAPAVIDAIKDPANKQALRFFSSPDEIQYPYALPPGAAADVVQAYRKAFAEATKDAAYLADAKRRHQDIEPHTGPEVLAVMEALYATPKDVVERVAKVTRQFAKKKKKKGDAEKKS